MYSVPVNIPKLSFIGHQAHGQENKLALSTRDEKLILPDQVHEMEGMSQAISQFSYNKQGGGADDEQLKLPKTKYLSKANNSRAGRLLHLASSNDGSKVGSIPSSSITKELHKTQQ